MVMAMKLYVLCKAGNFLNGRATISFSRRTFPIELPVIVYMYIKLQKFLINISI
jgi:hypothetical protein